MMAAHPDSEITWSVLPEERDGSDEAGHNAGFLDGRLNDGADSTCGGKQQRNTTSAQATSGALL